MRALTVAPGIANSARVEDVAEPPLSDGAVSGAGDGDRRVRHRSRYRRRALWLGAARSNRLVIGHELLGIVREAPPGSGVKAGRPCCRYRAPSGSGAMSSCAIGEWDMCRNGRYTERGIKERHGYGSEFFRIEPEFLIKVDSALGVAGVLLEPTSIVAKAWDHTERIGNARAHGSPKRCW